ncbi:MAG: hypothetical protein JST12_08255 [Armatimonadetes bacterium]|nr:hypothetical protein [Armatimonadota bacterium]
MTSALLALFTLQTASPAAPVDQTWKFQMAAKGRASSPVGTIDNFSLTGELSFAIVKKLPDNLDLVRLKLKLKRNQNKLLEAFTTGFDKVKEGDRDNSTYQDGEFAYVTELYTFDRTKATVVDYNSTTDSSSAQILESMALALAMVQQCFNGPELRHEYPLAKDGPRNYFITYRENLNANTDESQGEAAYKFNLKLKDHTGTYPNFFTGAVRLNRKTGYVRYITTTSYPIDQPSVNDNSGESTARAWSIRLDEKERD